MDLNRHLTVLRRWRLIAIAGLGIALALSFAVALKVSFDGGLKVGWRSKPTYQSTSRLFVTQVGFPWGRVVLPTAAVPGAAPAQPTTRGDKTQYASPERFADLAVVYSYLANSEQVRALMRPQPEPDKISVIPVLNPGTGTGLPLLEVQTRAEDATVATRLNASAVGALARFLDAQQKANRISAKERVQIQVLNPPSPAKIVKGRPLIGAVLTFLLAIGGTIGLIYILENFAATKRRDDDQGRGGLRESLEPRESDELEVAYERWPASA